MIMVCAIIPVLPFPIRRHRLVTSPHEVSPSWVKLQLQLPPSSGATAATATGRTPLLPAAPATAAVAPATAAAAAAVTVGAADAGGAAATSAAAPGGSGSGSGSGGLPPRAPPAQQPASSSSVPSSSAVSAAALPPAAAAPAQLPAPASEALDAAAAAPTSLSAPPPPATALSGVPRPQVGLLTGAALTAALSDMLAAVYLHGEAVAAAQRAAAARRRAKAAAKRQVRARIARRKVVACILPSVFMYQGVLCAAFCCKFPHYAALYPRVCPPWNCARAAVGPPVGPRERGRRWQ